MLQDLSLHILDLVQNSLAAQASLVQISIIEDSEKNLLVLSIKDNGRGMEASLAAKAADPFVTSRKTRRVGLGLAFLKASAEACDGHFMLLSKKGKGTEVTASFALNHIDRPPLGEMEDTLASLIACNPSIDFVYEHSTSYGKFQLDTREIRAIIKDVPINDVDIIQWIHNYIKEGLDEINGGA